MIKSCPDCTVDTEKNTSTIKLCETHSLEFIALFKESLHFTTEDLREDLPDI